MNIKVPTRVVSDTASSSQRVNLSGTWQAHTSSSTITTTDTASGSASVSEMTYDPRTKKTRVSISLDFNLDTITGRPQITSISPSSDGWSGSVGTISGSQVTFNLVKSGAPSGSVSITARATGTRTTTVTDYWYANDTYYLGNSSYDYSSFSLFSGTRPTTLRGSNGYVYAHWERTTRPSGTTVTCAGYVNYTYPTTRTYANVYFNGTRVNYVYFNGTRYP